MKIQVYFGKVICQLGRFSTERRPFGKKHYHDQRQYWIWDVSVSAQSEDGQNHKICDCYAENG